MLLERSNNVVDMFHDNNADMKKESLMKAVAAL